LVSSVVDKETQAKIDVVKQRLINNYGYDETSATDILNFVASIFARGDAKKNLRLMCNMALKIQTDYNRFKKIIRGKIKQDLKNSCPMAR
jgi:hypothetical protein